MARMSLLLPLLLTACAFSGPRQSQTYYVLAAVPAPTVVSAITLPGVLVVRDMDVPAFYQDPALVYSREIGTRGHYQYARYTDPVGVAITVQVLDELRRAALFRGVAAQGKGIGGDWLLDLRLIDLYHEAVSAPGQVRLSLEADLVRRDGARLQAHTRIEVAAPAASFDAKGAAAASNQALAEAIAQLVIWLKAEAR